MNYLLQLIFQGIKELIIYNCMRHNHFWKYYTKTDILALQVNCLQTGQAGSKSNRILRQGDKEDHFVLNYEKYKITNRK